MVAVRELPQPGPARAFLLDNRRLQAVCTTAGAALVALRVPDKSGSMQDVVLGYDDLTQYLRNQSYMGAIVGRYAGVVPKGRLRFGEQLYSLAKNAGEDHLHGGDKGLSFRLWQPEAVENGIGFCCNSPSGEEGYPGDLTVHAAYCLDENALTIRYRAVSSRASPVNITSHSYFNLHGDGQEGAGPHSLRIFAASCFLNDEQGIPSGGPIPAKGIFDLRRDTVLFGYPYDHFYVLDHPKDCAAELTSPISGIIMRMQCTQPGLQLYTANELSEYGRGNRRYQPGDAVCLEPQHYPAAVGGDCSHTSPVEEYSHWIRYSFTHLR